MKKTLIIAFALAMAAGLVHAEPAPTHTVGVRVGYGIGFHRVHADNDWGTDDNGLPNLNIGLYYAHRIMGNISIQAELNFALWQGLRVENQWYDPLWRWEYANYRYNSLDIPVLVRLNFFRDRLGLLAGPHISIPLGSLEEERADFQEYSHRIDTFATFGFTAGAIGSFPIGPIRFVGDIRYAFDINGIRVGGVTVMNRRALTVSFGFEGFF